MIKPHEDLMVYKEELYDALCSVSETEIKSAFNAILKAIDEGYPIILMGNGGSAAIAEHFVCDFWKGIESDCLKHPNVMNLGSNQALLTAIANDMDYNCVFQYQILTCNAPKALVIAISSSGKSGNIVAGLKAAKSQNYKTIALVGFTGGRVMIDQLADTIIHVRSDNYGIIEDAHSVILHSLAQTYRKGLTYKERKDLTL